MKHDSLSRARRFLRHLAPALAVTLIGPDAIHGRPVLEPLHVFERGPEYPIGKLIRGSDGNFYGTTCYGGDGNYGTVFKITAAGALVTLVHFNKYGNGSTPYAALVEGSDGNFYGTTMKGGAGDCGTVFRMTPGGVLTTIGHFNGGNGIYPDTPLVEGPDGSFYGTTLFGGNGIRDLMGNSGTAFKISATGGLTTLVHFSNSLGTQPGPLMKAADGCLYGTTVGGGGGGADRVFRMADSGELTTMATLTNTVGRSCHTPLVQGTDGNLYGTSTLGGSGGGGTVFKMTPTGELTALVSFSQTKYFSSPGASIVQGPDGDFYGTTTGGGSNDGGTAFKMTSSGSLTTLVNFTNSSGTIPTALEPGADGTFYGATYAGGGGGCGTVFKMTPAGALTTLASLNSPGRNPEAGLVQGADGFFYGTTEKGGSDDCGTVFRMGPDGAFATLASFSGSNGKAPRAALVQGGDGNFHGTTYFGGTHDFGTVFQVTPTGDITVMVNFTDSNGANPEAALVLGGDGNFYGTTSRGGTNGYGTVFKLAPSGTHTALVNFNNSNGRLPRAALVEGSDGDFYGTTSYGGTSEIGTVFRMTPTGTLTTMANFNGWNGRYPYEALFQGDDGDFYGTTLHSANPAMLGTVFKMTMSGALTTLVNFAGNTGGYPNSALILGGTGGFYGTSGSDPGSVFMVTNSGMLAPLVRFNTDIGTPNSIIRGNDGHLYCTTFADRSTHDGALAGGGRIVRVRMGPVVASQPVSDLTPQGATLDGKVNPGGHATLVSFQYGTSPTLANYETASVGTLSAGTEDIPVYARVSGLHPGTTYYYRVMASNGENQVPQCGSILSFTTPDAPDIALEAPTGSAVVDGTDALVFGSATPGQSTDVELTIRNTGTAALTSIAVSITGPDAGYFSIVGTSPGSLATGESANFTVRFIPPDSTAARIAMLVITSNDPDESPLKLTLCDRDLSTPEAWRLWFFSQIQNNGNAADQADPDGDGLANLQERAFNLDPTNPAQPVLARDSGTTGLPLIHITGNPKVISIQYLRRKASTLPQLTYVPQVSWFPGSDDFFWSVPTGTERVESIDNEWERVTIEENTEGFPIRFGRVAVTSPP